MDVRRSSMTAGPARKRSQPPTHPSVYVGLALAAVGLLLAMYAYTGTRVYDLLYAFVALGGGALALAGILTAAWGRAIAAQRAARARRGLAAATGASPPAPAQPAEAAPQGAQGADDDDQPAPPTVASPKNRLRFPLRRSSDEKAPKEAPPREPKRKRFALGRAADAPPATAPDAAVQAVQVAAPAEPRRERLHLQCPSCDREFTSEGVRPFDAACPSCGFTASV